MTPRRRNHIPFRVLCLLALLCLFVSSVAAEVQAAPRRRQGNKLHFVVYGDTRDGHREHRKIVDFIMQQNPEFVLQTGDMVSNGADPELWAIYDDITKYMRSQVPVYLARGNHDVGGKGYENHVQIPGPNTSGSKLYYSFDKGSWHFVSFDCFSAYQPGSKQYVWLESDLSQAQKKAKHTILFCHTAPFSDGLVHGSDLKLRAVLHPLAIKYGVRLIFNGHEHMFYRTTRDGVTYVITGGGGAPLYPLDHKRDIAGDAGKSAYHIVVCDLDGSKITLTTLLDDGTVFDKFTLN